MPVRIGRLKYARASGSVAIQASAGSSIGPRTASSQATPNARKQAESAKHHSCWRSTPSARRNRITMDTAAATRVATVSSRKQMIRTVPAVPLSTEYSSDSPSMSNLVGGTSSSATAKQAEPATPARTAYRHRGDSSRPSGATRNMIASIVRMSGDPSRAATQPTT